MKAVKLSLKEVISQLELLGEYESAQHLRLLRDALSHPALRIVVFGEFNRGKSTLINALIGRVVLPAKLIPTTGQITRLLYGEPEEIRVHYFNGDSETCGLEQLDAVASLGLDGQAREDIEIIEVAVNSPLLRQGLVFIDTPGLNDKDAQTSRAMQAISMADVVLLILDARQLLSKRERQLAVDWLSKDFGKPVVPILNFLNFVEDYEQPGIRKFLDQWCNAHLRAKLGNAWFEVNALGALKHAVQNVPKPEDNFELLRNTLASYRGRKRKRLQRHSRLSQLQADLRLLQEGNQQLLDALHQDEERVMKERKQLFDQLNAQKRRLKAGTTTKRDALSVAAEKRLQDQLESLLKRLQGQSKEQLDANVSQWYKQMLLDTTLYLEREANHRLSELADDNLNRPSSLALQERFILDARIQLGDFQEVEISGVVVGGAAGVGAVMGTVFIPVPVLGTIIGGVLGTFAGAFFGSSQSDVVAAYTSKVQEHFGADRQKLLDILQRQFSARAGVLTRQLNAKITAAQYYDQSLADERKEREKLQKLLVRVASTIQEGLS